LQSFKPHSLSPLLPLALVWWDFGGDLRGIESKSLGSASELISNL
jgi:hypothetical protein